MASRTEDGQQTAQLPATPTDTTQHDQHTTQPLDAPGDANLAPITRVLAITPSLAPTIPLAITVQVRSTRPSAQHKQLEKPAVWDSGAGASLMGSWLMWSVRCCAGAG